MTPSEIGMAEFTQATDKALRLLTSIFPDCFVSLVVVGTNPRDEEMTLAQMKMNVENGVAFAEHIKLMCDNIISGDVPTADLTDCKGGMQ